MVLASEAPERTFTQIKNTTHRIVEDFGIAYIVERSKPNGELTFEFLIAHPRWGKHPVLGIEPLGKVFPIMKLFGITILRSNCVYSRRDWSRWKAFVDWSIFDSYSPEEALQMVRQVGLKWMKENA